MNQKNLLLRLNGIAIPAKQALKAKGDEDRQRKQTDSKLEKDLILRQKARELVEEKLTEEKLMAYAKGGGTHYPVYNLDRWVEAHNLLGFEKFVFEEINKLGFKALIISDLDPEADDHTDYSIGIQWRDL